MQPTPPGPGRTFRIVTVASVRVELPDQYPTVTLEDAEVPGRTLSFRIGLPEGVALSQALEGVTAPRPSTHDLFTSALQRYAIDILAVRLVGRVGATYLAELDLVGGHGREVLACRPSDGICLALRQRVPAPLLADDRLFTEAGDVLDDGLPDDGLPDRAPGQQAERGARADMGGDVGGDVGGAEPAAVARPEPAEAGA